MVGVLGASMNMIMRGPVTTMADVTRRTVAENNIIAAARLAIVMAPVSQPLSGDCDSDGLIEPIAFRDPAAAPHPSGGGLLPTTLGASLSDPWQTGYGYCAWDHGSSKVSDAVAACGGATARRLNGAPGETQIVIAVLSAGKDRAFQTSCNAFADTNSDGTADTPLLLRPAGSDDLILGYTYAEANTVGSSLWALKTGEPTTATIGKDIEVSGDAEVSGLLRLAGGLVLPGDPGDNSLTGPCNSANDQVLRRNTAMSPPLIEICDFAGGATGWVPIGGLPALACLAHDTLIYSGTAWECSDNPDPFAFNDLSNQTINTVLTSNIVSVSGTAGARISISGTGNPHYRICSTGSCSTVTTDWTSAAGTIAAGSYVQLRLTSAGANGLTRTAGLQIGLSSDSWSVATPDQDDTPDAINFVSVNSQPVSTLVSSNTVTVTGIGPAATPVSVTGQGSPQIRIAGGAWLTSGVISSGQSLQTRLTSPSSGGANHTASVSVGTVTANWSVSTSSQDDTPDTFSFTDATGATPGALVMSNSLIIQSIGPGPVTTFVTGIGNPQISIDGGAWVTSGTISQGQSLRLRLTASTASGDVHHATVTVGTASDQWTVATVVQDNTPDSFEFLYSNLNAPGTLVESNLQYISGIGPGAALVSITGQGSPQISVNGGAWTTSSTISNGQSLRLRLTSSTILDETYQATVSVGTANQIWYVRTNENN